MFLLTFEQGQTGERRKRGEEELRRYCVGRRGEETKGKRNAGSHRWMRGLEEEGKNTGGGRKEDVAASGDGRVPFVDTTAGEKSQK